MHERLYFAYGSNIDLDQMRFRCPDAVPVMPVVLRDYELSFRGHSGVATILPKEGANVPGLLWDLTPACEQALDHYEGYPHLYDKETVWVRDQTTGDSYRVMAYIMTPQNAEIRKEPSPWYFNGILQGYKQNGMPVQPLYDALRRTREEIARQESLADKGFVQMDMNWWQDRAKKTWRKPKNKGR